MTEESVSDWFHQKFFNRESGPNLAEFESKYFRVKIFGFESDQILRIWTCFSQMGPIGIINQAFQIGEMLVSSLNQCLNWSRQIKYHLKIIDYLLD